MSPLTKFRLYLFQLGQILMAMTLPISFPLVVITIVYLMVFRSEIYDIQKPPI